MPLATAVAIRIQFGLEDRHPSLAALSIIDRHRVGPWLAGALLGLAYVAAELPNSFAKRRLGIPAGGYARRLGGVLQYVVDLSDSVVGCLLMLRLLGRPSHRLMMVAGLMGVGTHAAVDLLMRVIHLKR
jgi:hypothetical protein